MAMRRVVIWLNYRGELELVLQPIPVGVHETISTAVRDIFTELSNQYICHIHEQQMLNVSVEIDGHRKSLHDLGEMLVDTNRQRWIPIFIDGRHTGIFFKL